MRLRTLTLCTALVAATLVWFSALAIGLLMAGQNISTLFG